LQQGLVMNWWTIDLNYTAKKRKINCLKTL
jgi:hypothetical protein